ncbi:hypothetical protein EJB05_35079, partial [Eragrostis curvula]
MLSGDRFGVVPSPFVDFIHVSKFTIYQLRRLSMAKSVQCAQELDPIGAVDVAAVAGSYESSMEMQIKVQGIQVTKRYSEWSFESYFYDDLREYLGYEKSMSKEDWLPVKSTCLMTTSIGCHQRGMQEHRGFLGQELLVDIRS